jgi:hypothetical protein
MCRPVRRHGSGSPGHLAADQPPSRKIVCPVMYPEAGEARKRVKSARPFGRPLRPMRVWFARAVVVFSLLKSVAVRVFLKNPGVMALQGIALSSRDQASAIARVNGFGRGPPRPSPEPALSGAFV